MYSFKLSLLLWYIIFIALFLNIYISLWAYVSLVLTAQNLTNYNEYKIPPVFYKTAFVNENSSKSTFRIKYFYFNIDA